MGALAESRAVYHHGKREQRAEYHVWKLDEVMASVMDVSTLSGGSRRADVRAADSSLPSSVRLSISRVRRCASATLTLKIT